jgi:hypothetical protein
MNDPLSRALEEAPRRRDKRRGDVSHHRAPHAPALGVVLDRLRSQLVEAMEVPFFDAGAVFQSVPVTKHLLSEMGAVTILARKREHVRCDDGRGRIERGVAVTVRVVDGRLQLDAALLREDLAAAIRAIGKAP